MEYYTGAMANQEQKQVFREALESSGEAGSDPVGAVSNPFLGTIDWGGLPQFV